MNPELLPAILAKDENEFSKKLKILEGRAQTAQLDIMDGKFVPHTTFQNPKTAAEIKLTYELHLMVLDPEDFIEKWSKVPNVLRAVIHAEIKKPLEPVVRKIKNLGWEAGIALNPETPWEIVDNLIPIVDTVLVMTVHPGKSGQPFHEAVPEFHLLSKISELHKAHPGLIISADGGVSEDTLPMLLEAGVSRFAAGSAIWNSPNPLSALQKLTLVACNL